MTTLFTTILNMSLTASYVSLAVIAVRILFKKMPKIFSLALWLSVLLRLVCPFSFRSDLSLLNFLNPNAQINAGSLKYIPNTIGFMQHPTVDLGVNEINNVVNALLPAATPAASVNPMQIIILIGSTIWVIGIALLLIYSIISYLKVIHNVKTATLVSGNIFETDSITTPFVCGFIKPKIFIPVGMSENESSYILAHEQTHIKRLDYLVKPFAFLVLIIHWFNPLMWLSFTLMSKDMEMSCDESVLKKMGNAIKGSYSNSLFSLSVQRSGLRVGSPLAFGESNIKSRIKNILTYKKPAFWAVVFAIIVTTFLIVVFTTNPKNEQFSESATVPLKGSDYNTEVLFNADANIQEGINNQTEEYLKIIISSPGLSSNPNDYIKAHQNEYENIVKMGDGALHYLLAQFEKSSNNNDLRGHIMMALCKDLLGDRNNVTDESLSPMGWYAKLSPLEEIRLPDFKVATANAIEQLVYDTAVKQYAHPNDGFTVVAPTIFGSYDEGDKLKVFVTVYSSRYKLYGKILTEVGGSVIPAAITYTKNADGSYTLDEYLEAMDGSYWAKSIKEYCIKPVSKKEIKGLFDKISKDYNGYETGMERSQLLMKNLAIHLKSNNQTGIFLNDTLIN